MKTIKSKKTTVAMLIAIVLFLSARSAFAYPPENAAVLYFQACILYEVDSGMNKMLNDMRGDRLEPNEEIREFLKTNRRAIDFVLDASEVRDCDWGLDYSQGCEVLAPPFSKFRNLTFLVAADAKVLAWQGDHKTALGRCLSLKKMSRHVNERLIISYLVGVAIDAVANRSIVDILSDMPQDIETLTWFKTQLVQIENRPLLAKPALRGEHESGIICMSPERIAGVVHAGLDDGAFRQKILQRVRAADKQFFDRNKQYWNNYMTEIITAFDLPYLQGYPKLARLGAKPSEEFSKNPDATLTVALAPAWQRIYTLAVRLQTHTNAIKAAIEVYLINARTGALPDALLDGLPGDLFSGKDFEYEKTGDGFILRCRAKDLDKDEIHQYEFKTR